MNYLYNRYPLDSTQMATILHVSKNSRQKAVSEVSTRMTGASLKPQETGDK
jgi:hypothetical protein